jgi:hypothetical protein
MQCIDLVSIFESGVGVWVSTLGHRTLETCTRKTLLVGVGADGDTWDLVDMFFLEKSLLLLLYTV